MTDRINITDPLAEICERLGLEPSFVKKLTIDDGTATATVYRRHPDHGGKFLENDQAATDTQTFKVRT